MRIGWFTDTFLPQTNGVVTALESFGKELVERGHEIHVFCPKSDREEYLGMKIHSVPAITFRPYPEFRIGIPITNKIPELDIVHTHGPFSLGLLGLRTAKKQEIPKISTFHTIVSGYVSYLSKRSERVQKELEKIAWKYCKMHYNKYDAVLTPSSTIKSMLEEEGITVKIDVVPNGIDVNNLKPVPKAKEKLELDGRVFLSLSRLSFEKNIDVIIKAMKYVDGQLLIAGKGPAEKSLKRLTMRLKLDNKVDFLGYVDEKKKPLLYSAADAFVIASTGETQGLVIVEAMACGTPVIGADYLAIPELVKDRKNGYLFEAGNVKQLTDIINNYSKKKNLVDNSKKTAKEYSIEKCTDRLEKLYKSL